MATVQHHAFTGIPRAAELAGEELIEAFIRHKRNVFRGPDVDDYLTTMGASGSASGNDILLASDVRTTEAWEEFLHTIQERLGMRETMSRRELEIRARQFMVRHQRLLGISDADIQIVASELQYYTNQPNEQDSTRWTPL